MYDAKDEVVQLYLDDIIPNRFQPREIFDEKALKELAVSIKEHGIIQPIIVRNVNGKYEIIAGERRYKASALAGMTKIPAIIRDLDDKESSKVALLENLQRKNLNPIEEARTYQKILELDQMTQEELAKTMGKSQSSVANKLRLLSLSEEIQESILKEKISERHARALLNVNDTKIQKELLEKVVNTKMSVRALEEEIKELYPKGKDASEIPISSNKEANASEFLNNSPLTPTATEIDEEISNYGKIVIAPPTMGEPKGENESNMGNLINYGKSEQEQTSIPSPEVPLSPNGAALDNLLNIPTSQTIPTASTNVEVESTNNIGGISDDYFQKSDLTSIPAINPGITSQSNIIPVSNSASSEPKEEMATRRIKELVEELRNNGVSISLDEMNFPKSYQVIIKIDKN